MPSNPSIFKGRTAAEVFMCPQIEADTPGFVLGRLSWCFAQTRGPIVMSEFGAQWARLWADIAAHLDAGRRIFGTLDHVQFTGPSEQKVVHPFILSHPAPWQSQDLVVGTSPYKSQILHSKLFCFNAPIFGYVPPADDYDSVEDAFAAGAAVSWFGSLNISEGAPFQSNTTVLMPGVTLATMFVDDVTLDHQFICRSQQAYQPYPLKPIPA